MLCDTFADTYELEDFKFKLIQDKNVLPVILYDDVITFNRFERNYLNLKNYTDIIYNLSVYDLKIHNEKLLQYHSNEELIYYEMPKPSTVTAFEDNAKYGITAYEASKLPTSQRREFIDIFEQKNKQNRELQDDDLYDDSSSKGNKRFNDYTNRDYADRTEIKKEILDTYKEPDLYTIRSELTKMQVTKTIHNCGKTYANIKSIILICGETPTAKKTNDTFLYCLCGKCNTYAPRKLNTGYIFAIIFNTHDTTYAYNTKIQNVENFNLQNLRKMTKIFLNHDIGDNLTHLKLQDQQYNESSFAFKIIEK